MFRAVISPIRRFGSYAPRHSYIKNYLNQTSKRFCETTTCMSFNGFKIGASVGFIGSLSWCYYDTISCKNRCYNFSSVGECLNTIFISSAIGVLGAFYYTLPIVGVIGCTGYVVFDVVPKYLRNYTIIKRN